MWTRFMDMHSGGGSKEPYEYIYIEAAEDEAKVIFYNRFGHNPERVTCTCCGDDYSISSEEDFAQLTGYDRGCASGYVMDDGEIKGEDYWRECGLEERRALNGKFRYFERQGERTYGRQYVTVDEYQKSEGVLVIHASEISAAERVGEVPSQGYVWV